MGKLFILSVEEDDLETVEKIMALIESTELVMCTDIPSAPLRYKALCIDAACRQVFWQGKFIELTPMEFDVFHLLARRPGWVFSQRVGSVFFGMIILVAGQLIVEHVYSYAIPISVFITVGGGIYFLYLLLTKRRV